MISLFSLFLSEFLGLALFGFSKSPISSITIAIFIGLLIGNTFKRISIFDMGFQFCIKSLLKIGIILLGIKLSFSDILNISYSSLVVVIPCILITLFSVLLLGKYFKIPKRLCILIGVGTSICGATAIVATAPAIEAEQEEVSFAIANITLFGLFAMLTYPYLSNFLFSNNSLAAGLFLGSSIHDTSQVTGAAMVYNEQFSDKEVLNIAIVTKLIRNTAMAIIIPFIAIRYKGKNKNNKKSKLIDLKQFPLFILGFVLFGLFRSIGDYTLNRNDIVFGFLNLVQWDYLIYLLSMISKFILTVAMSAVGVTTNLKNLKKMGIEIFYFGFIVAILVGLLSFSIIRIFIL